MQTQDVTVTLTLTGNIDTINQMVNRMSENRTAAAIHQDAAPKKGKAAKEPAPEKTEEETFDLGGPVETKATTLEDVLKAFNGFLAAKGKPAAINVLKDFKVKSVRDIAAPDYPALMKVIG